MLETLANVAEILAGLAIVVSVIRLWPALGEIRGKRKLRKPKDVIHLEAIRQGLEEYGGFECPSLRSIADARDAILRVLVQGGSTDFHLSQELVEGQVRGTLRFRRNGRRTTVCAFEPYLTEPLIESFRALAIPDQPTFERIKFELDDKEYDARVNLQHSTQGSYFVARLLDPGSASMPLNMLGIPERILSRLNNVIDQQKPGLLIFSGPMGSGKTVVLYSTLNELMQKDVEIASVEDPVEIDIPGLSQFQVLDTDGMRLKDRIDGVFQSDLDVLMLGEIKDELTARAAIKFANTEGLVLTTLATEDAASAVIRLHNFDPTELWHGGSDSRRLILNQRLVRKVCPNCRQPYTPTAGEQALVDEILAINKVSLEALESEIAGMNADFQFMQAVGCDQCTGGFTGRVGCYEALIATPEMEDLCRASDELNFDRLRKNLRNLAIENGMKTISYHWLEWAAIGTVDFRHLRPILPYGEP